MMETAIDVPDLMNVWTPEEEYFPTALRICGLMDEVARRSVTHSKWDHKARGSVAANGSTKRDESGNMIVTGSMTIGTPEVIRVIRAPIA
eukprot:scaffold39886_cov45-Cyclotella_meneghiniana.AAC.1